MLLAIDTATCLLGIALHDGDRLLAECTLVVDRSHSAVLAPMIKQIMERTGVTGDELTGLAVSVGPGSYTGLRIGVALAKGMAAARGLPLVPVTTLDTLAAGQGEAERSLPLLVTVPAGRNRIIWAPYHHVDGRWQASGEARLGNWATLIVASDETRQITGEISVEGLREIRSAIDTGCGIKLLPAAQRLRRAGYLAEIAWGRLRESGVNAFPADRVMPVYLKSPG